MENNTNRIMPPDAVPVRSRRGWKILFLGIMSSLFLIIDWWLIKTALYSDKSLTFWSLPTIATCLAIVFLTFFFLSNHNKLYSALLILVSLLPYVYLFPKNLYVLIGALLFLVLVIIFEQRIRSEERGRHDFSIRRVSSSSLSVVVYAFLLLLGLNIYYNTSADFKSDPESFYDSLGRSAAKSAKYISGENRSGIDFNQSMNQFLETQAKEDNLGFESLPPIQQREIVEQSRQEFYRQFDLKASPEQPLSEIIAQVAVDRAKQSVSRFESLFPLIFTLIILALLRTFSFVFRWITVAVTWVLFKAFVGAKFFRLTRVPVEVQKLDL